MFELRSSRTALAAIALGCCWMLEANTIVPARATALLAQTDSSEASPTPTQQAEQDAERKLQAAKDAEQARQEAAERLRADRLAAAAAAGKAALIEAAGFVKVNRDDPQLLDHLQHIADLNGALPGSEPASIERQTATLRAGLAADPIYIAYQAQRSTEQRREAVRDLADAVRTLKIQKSFLIGAVVQDPTATEAANFLALAKQAGALLANPELERAQTLVGTIDAAVATAGLRASYALAQQAALAAQKTTGAKSSVNDQAYPSANKAEPGP